MAQEIIEKKGTSPADMIRLAITEKGDLDKLEKLLALQERYEANEARKLFASSFAIAQEKIAVVVKNKLNPQTHSKYADLGNIIESAKPVYTKEGFSMIFYEGETKIPENIRICVDVLHTAGHQKTYFYDVPLDGVGIKGNPNMTKIHGKSSSAAYGRRYLMSMVWNIPTKDDDGNAAGAPVELIGEKELSQILDYFAELGAKFKKDKFLAYMKITKIEEISKNDFKKAITVLEQARKEKAGKK